MASLFCNRTKMCLNIGKQSYSYSAPSSALVNGRISVHLSLIKGASGGEKVEPIDVGLQWVESMPASY